MCESGADSERASVGGAGAVLSSSAARGTDPVADPWGARKIVYVPVAGRTTVSMNPPPVPKLDGATSVDPSGSAIEIRLMQQVGPILTLTRCPTVPANVTSAFWPGVVVVTVTAAPPGVALAVASGATSWSVSVMLP